MCYQKDEDDCNHEQNHTNAHIENDLSKWMNKCDLLCRLQREQLFPKVVQEE